MTRQVFVEGEIFLTAAVADVNFAGRSRIIRPTAIIPTRVDTTGGQRLRHVPLVLLPEWLHGPWQVGERWRIVGKGIRNTSLIESGNAGVTAHEARVMRDALAKLAVAWVRAHQERHALKALAPATASFVAGRMTAATWWRHLAAVAGEHSPLVTTGPLVDGVQTMQRLIAGQAVPAITMTVLTQATKLAAGSMMAETADPRLFPQAPGSPVPPPFGDEVFRR